MGAAGFSPYIEYKKQLHALPKHVTVMHKSDKRKRNRHE